MRCALYNTDQVNKKYISVDIKGYSMLYLKWQLQVNADIVDQQKEIVHL